VWPVHADHFDQVTKRFFSGGLDALMIREGVPGAGRKVFEVWNVADPAIISSQLHDWAERPLPLPGTTTVVNVSPQYAPLLAEKVSGMEAIRGPMSKLDVGLVAKLQCQLMTLEAGIRAAAFRVLMPVFVRTCNEVPAERLARCVSLNVTALRTRNQIESLEGAAMLAHSDPATEAHLAEWVRSSYFASAATRLDRQGNPRPVRVLRRRRDDATPDSEVDFEATSLDTLIITMMDRADLDAAGALRFLTALNALPASQRVIVLSMFRLLLREVGRFVVHEARIEDATWRLQTPCE
jgi:hypothetical protein